MIVDDEPKRLSNLDKQELDMDEFRVGGVLRDAARLLSRHIVLLLGFALIFVAVPKILAAGVAQRLIGSGHPVWAALPAIMSFFASTVLAVAVMRTAAEAANHRTPRLAEGLASSLRLFFPVLGVSLVSSIGIGLGSILLVFPGAMLACCWIVAIPVQAVERPGVFASLRRSAELTRGVRWRIFGLVLLCALIGFVTSTVVLGFLGFAVGSSFGLGQVKWAFVIGEAVVSAGVGLSANAVFVSIYLALRRMKDGGLSGDLVAAFE